MCPHGITTDGASYDPSGEGYPLDECRRTSFNGLQQEPAFVPGWVVSGATDRSSWWRRPGTGS